MCEPVRYTARPEAVKYRGLARETVSGPGAVTEV